MDSVKRSAISDATNLLVRTDYGRRILLPQYRYMFSPEQLWSLCQAAESVLPLGGAFAEIGAADGRTTVYLHRHLEKKGEAPTYYCIDTFNGFTSEDIKVERARGKTDNYAESFFNNSKKRFQRTMKMNGLDRTVVVQADAATFDYSSLPPLSFALVDVDLLRPMRAALAGCWDRLLPGGILVVDDCDPSVNIWDGAHEAFVEFCEKQGLPIDIRHEKLGFASRPLVPDVEKEV
jgi:predicted O-methyltransferase YrrM